MKFSYNWLKDYIQGRVLPAERLAEVLTTKVFEVNDVVKKGNDWLLDIDVLPNRATDCFSHWGMAKEIAAILNLKFKVEDFELKENKRLKIKDFIEVEVKDRNACPRYSARAVTGIKANPSPRWMQERLRVCGLRPINNIVDMANYVMLETGQPLHAFDADKIEGKKIIVRFAKENEKITTLDKQDFSLNDNVLIIADKKRPLAIAGIKGGKRAEISKSTKAIILESANFDPKTIRRGSRRLNLTTDASLRFENGVDLNLAEIALKRAASLIEKMVSGETVSGIIDFYPRKISSSRTVLNLDRLKSVLGVEVPVRRVMDILKRLNLRILNLKDRFLTVEVPTIRPDISLEEDLIEEIGRMYGYERIPSVFPVASLVPPERNLDIFWEEFSKDCLKETGFSEVYNCSFISEKEINQFSFDKKKVLKVKNPISDKYNCLRPSLIPLLIANAVENFRYFKEMRIFELGKIYKKQSIRSRKKENTVVEKNMLAGIILRKDGDDDLFFELKGAIDTLLNKMGISNFYYDQYQATPEESVASIWNPQKSAEIKINGEEIGFLGEISAKILESFNLKAKVFIFDIDFERLTKLACEEHEYRPISPYPTAIRDLSILVPKNVPVEKVLGEAETAGGPLVRDIDLFDIYEGKEIPGEKKSLAFRIIYQADNRTLSSEEIGKLQKKIIKALEANRGWKVRRQ